MTDQLDELLADLRASAVREIRPPGAAAARRTVRLRRTTGVVAVACALTAALVGGIGLAQRPSAAPVLPADAPPPSPSPSFSVSPAQRLAADALRRISDDQPAYEQAGPVQPGDFEKRMYLPRLTVTVLCAGAGELTLVVTGDVANDGLNRFPDRELARIKVPCGAGTEPISRRLDVATLPVLRFNFKGTETAYEKAGYALRVTGDGDAPLAPDDKAASVEEALGMNSGSGRSGGSTPEDEPFDGDYRLSAQFAQFPDKELYTLVIACRGTGRYSVQLRRTDGGKVLGEHSVDCSWPPAPSAVDLPEPLGHSVEFWTRYEAAPSERAETGWSLYTR